MSYDAAGRSAADLLRDWSAIMRALRKKGVIRTNNNPAGDIAEAIVAEHYQGERASFSNASWDVQAPDGERIEVKAIRQTPTNRRTNTSPIRKRDYDAVVVVILDEDFMVTEGLRMTREVVEDVFPHNQHVNGRIIRVTKKLRADPRVESVDLSQALAHLG